MEAICTQRENPKTWPRYCCVLLIPQYEQPFITESGNRLVFMAKNNTDSCKSVKDKMISPHGLKVQGKQSA